MSVIEPDPGLFFLSDFNGQTLTYTVRPRTVRKTWKTFWEIWIRTESFRIHHTDTDYLYLRAELTEEGLKTINGIGTS